MFNPGLDYHSLLAVVLSDGSMQLWQIADQVMKCVARLSPTERITCCKRCSCSNVLYMRRCSMLFVLTFVKHKLLLCARFTICFCPCNVLYMTT